jgi:NhaP-type Na+/H+ and K+/H+ antiporter
MFCYAAASASFDGIFFIYLTTIIVQNSTLKQVSLTFKLIHDPSQSLMSLVSIELTDVEPFPEHSEKEFNTYLLTNNNRKLLSSLDARK